MSNLVVVCCIEAGKTERWELIMRLRGGRVIFKPTSYFTLKRIYGRQRTGFDISQSEVYGVDTEIVLSDIFQFKTYRIIIGINLCR
jgi:hypothetical protein